GAEPVARGGEAAGESGAGGALPGDQSGRHHAAGLCGGGWRAGIFPPEAVRLRARRQGLQGLREPGAAAHPTGKVDLLLRELSEVAGCHFLRCFFSSASTIGWTNSRTSPPNTAISRTSEEEMNVNCSCGVRKTVSMSRSRWRFMLASWNSNSKSEIARRPRMITVARWRLANSTVSSEYPSTSTFDRSSRTRRARSIRASSGNMGVLLGLEAMATMTRSKMPAARRTRSWWPLVIGSKVPG